ncbi:MAG: hypothetical protein HQK51_05245 [Oligoflexia bacterium]|nr:hypothetical protein [Oligoflexia bacterium]
MSGQTKAIIFSDSKEEDLLLYSIETTYNFEVCIAKTWDQFQQSISHDVYQLIVLSIEGDKEILQKINDFFSTQKNENKPINSVLIVIGKYDQDDDNLKNMRSFGISMLVQNTFVVMEINKFIMQNFVRDDTYVENEFSPILLKTLMRFKILSFPAYIKLKTRYLKVLSQGDAFYSDDLTKYHSKGITHLYIKKKTSRWILEELDNHMQIIKENSNGQFDIVVPASEMPKEIFDDNIIKYYSKPVAVPTNPLSIPKKEELTLADEFKLTSDNDVISCSIGKPFQLQDHQYEEIKSNLNNIVKVVMKNPEIYKLLKMLKINRNKIEYYTAHIGSLINVCTAIAVNVDWKTERTIEKLVYACYFHDAGLSERPELASIKTENEAKEKKLSDDEIKLFLSHPSKIANLLKGADSFPDDVHVIVEQHHESPTGDGFPKKLGSTRIIPLSALFILSHGFVDYMIENENWNITDFIVIAKKNYPGNAFRKIIQSLELTKS